MRRNGRIIFAWTICLLAGGLFLALLYERAGEASPVRATFLTGGILDEGDSQSVFETGNHTAIYAQIHPDIAFSGRAMNGSRISNLSGRLADDMAYQPKLVTVLIGANDLSDDASYPTTKAWLQELFGYTDKWRSSGVRVLVGTVLARCGPNSAAVDARHNARRAAANAAIRQSIGRHIDGVIDYAADLEIGTEQAACDHRLFVDGLHPTAGNSDFSGGQGIMARIYGQAVDRALTDH